MKIQTSVTIDEGLMKKIDERAVKEKRSRSQMISILIEERIAQNGHTDQAPRTLTEINEPYATKPERPFAIAPKKSGKRRAKTVGE